MALKLIEEIKARLTKYPQLRIVEGEGSIEILPVDDEGFAIAVYEHGEEFTVAYGGGWHEEFSDPIEALNCVAFGLSEECRLQTTFRGNSPYRWVVEYLEDGDWIEDSVTALFFFPFWRPKKVTYRQNKVLQD